jgi:hypothetical protein
MKQGTAAALIAALLASACSGISVNQDWNPATDFSGFRTWDWMPEPNRPSGDPRADSEIVDQRIRGAIEAGLQRKGFSKADAGEPDFRVGYQIVLDDRVDFETVNDYWGSYWGYGGIYGGYYGPAVGTTRTYSREYTLGTLVLDFFDVASRELVWRGAAQGELRQYTDPVKKQERADLVVRKILDQFPPRR